MARHSRGKRCRRVGSFNQRYRTLCCCSCCCFRCRAKEAATYEVSFGSSLLVHTTLSHYVNTGFTPGC